MEQYDVKGMSCAACSARVEKAVSKVSGVSSCTVSLLTNSMSVDGTAAEQDIIAAVRNAGYDASVKGAKKAAKESDDIRDTETPRILRRLITSLVFLLILMYFSMGHMMLGLPVPPFFEGNHLALGILQMLLAATVMIINQEFFVSGFKGLIHLAPNMDTLVALGSGVSFVYSTAVLFMMTADHSGSLMNELYFESSAMILTLITVGKLLEARSKGRTTDALKSLMKLAPKTATVIRGGVETTVEISQVRTGDIFAVRPGRRHGFRRNDKPLGISQVRSDPRRRGYYTISDNKDGQRRRCDEGSDCQNRGQGFGRVCAGGNRDCRCNRCCLAVCRSVCRLFAGTCDFCARYQLSVRSRISHTRCDNGRQRSRR